MKLRCYNVTNSPFNYINARWTHPGFKASQNNTSEPIQTGYENGVSYTIWTMEVNVSAADTGKKWTIRGFFTVIYSNRQIHKNWKSVFLI